MIESKTLSVKAFTLLASRPETAEVAVEKLHPKVAGMLMPEEVRVVAL